MNDFINREEALHAIAKRATRTDEDAYSRGFMAGLAVALGTLYNMPATDLSKKYARNVMEWLHGCQIKYADHRHRYYSHEVIRWIIEDWWIEMKRRGL